MKVLLAATSTENFSGASRCLMDLATGLRDRGVDLTVSVPGGRGVLHDLDEANVPHVVIREHSSWWRWLDERHSALHYWARRAANGLSILCGARYIRRGGFDLVHVNASTAYVTGRAAQLAGVPVVWHIRESLEKDLGICYTNPRYSYAVLNRSSRMVAISQTVKEVWEGRVTPEIDVVYDGLRTSDYYVDRATSPWHEDVVRIGIYGRVTEGKGQREFFGAIKSLVSRGVTNVSVSWAGHVDEAEKRYFEGVQRFIADEGLSGYVTYLGEITDVNGFLRDMDVICVCSKFEGFGRTTVEGMLGGCAVVGADIGATTELVRDGENGYLYRRGDAGSLADRLEHVIRNPEEAHAVALRGQREALERYSIESDIDSVLGIYRDVLCGRTA